MYYLYRGGISGMNKIRKPVFLFLLAFFYSLFIEPHLPAGYTSAQTQFQVTIGGTANDYAASIIQTADGGYAVAGATQSFGAGDYDMYIVKLDAGGTLQWRRTAGGTFEDQAFSIIQTTDGGFAVAGFNPAFW